jgi:tetrahydromethanopterin S-methyltransferase subunit F
VINIKKFSIKNKMFGNATNEQIEEYLNSSEYRFYNIGAKKGLENGLLLGGFLGFCLGAIFISVISLYFI